MFDKLVEKDKKVMVVSAPPPRYLSKSVSGNQLGDISNRAAVGLQQAPSRYIRAPYVYLADVSSQRFSWLPLV